MKKIIVLLCLALPFMGFGQKNPFKNIHETANGYVGIGTDQPDALLTVNGSIHTREVMVDLDGAVAPDYVFEKYFTGHSVLKRDYEFTDLTTLEEFIRKNHHLPGIPSAEKMEETGMPLKEMNLLLLEKIEELTLHTIEQQKLIEDLNRRLEALENE